MSKKIKASVEIVVTDQDIDDIMVTALEGGINYWCVAAVKNVNDACYDVQYASEVISRGGSLFLFDAETEDKYELTQVRFMMGLKKFLQSPSAVHCLEGSKLDTGMIDASDADAIIQYALFDDIIYG